MNEMLEIARRAAPRSPGGGRFEPSFVHDAADFERLFEPQAQCAQLSLQQFTGEAAVLQTGAVRIVSLTARDSYQMRRTPSGNCVVLGYSAGPGAVTHRGQACSLREAIVLAADREAVLHLVGPSQFIWIEIDLRALHGAQAQALMEAMPDRAVLVTASDAAISGLRRYVSAVVMFHLNGLNEHQLHRRETELIDLVRRVLERSRPKRWNSKREKAFSLVQRVETFMWENVEDALTLDRICTAVACRARTLTYYFKSLVGVGPMTYLKIRRLENAHRRLQESAAPARIFDVAADFGFWHMGHFSSDYKRMFGTTATRTRATEI